MTLHPLLYDLLRSVEMESTDYPGCNLLWCGMNEHGHAIVAGVTRLSLTALDPANLYLKAAWPSMKSRRFDEIYRLLQQVHPDTPPLHKESRIPPMMSDTEFAAVHGIERADVTEPYTGNTEYWTRRLESQGLEEGKDFTISGRVYLKPGEGNITEVDPDAK